MSQSITLVVPDSIEFMAPMLGRFFEGMVHKLDTNSHKEPPRKCDVTAFILKLQGEVLETYKQWLENKHDPNLLMELCDIANFAFLVTVSMAYEEEDQRNQTSMEALWA